MKKKNICFLLILVLCVGLLGACGTKSDDTKNNTASNAATPAAGSDTSLSYITDKGELILGLDESFPPMGFRDDNQNIVGFDIDVAKAVCDKMGVKLKLQPISWDAKEQELSTKKIDCIWNGLSKNADREKNLTLSNTYMKNNQVAVVAANSGVNTLADLKGKTVAIQNGSTAADAIDAKPDFKSSLKDLVTVDDNVKALMDLKVGGSDAVVMDEVVARYYANKEAGTYKILDESLSQEEYVVGFRKGENELCNKVNSILSELKKDGTLSKISQTWFGKDIVTIE